jgi:hypothetical protein
MHGRETASSDQELTLLAASRLAPPAPPASENGKFLLTQFGAPDWTLVVWRWYSGKVRPSRVEHNGGPRGRAAPTAHVPAQHLLQVLASMRVELPRPVLSARFCPGDDLLLALLSPSALATYRLGGCSPAGGEGGEGPG